MTDFIYLNNHKYTKPLPQLIEVFRRGSKEYYASEEAPHFLGEEQKYPRQKAKKEIASIFQVDPSMVSFFRGGLEALEKIFFSAYLSLSRTEGKTLFLSSHRFPFFDALESLGVVVGELPVNEQGQIIPDLLEKKISLKTSLVYVSFADPYTGVIQPVSDLARICEEKGVLFVVEASSIFGKRFLQFAETGASYLVIDGGANHGLTDSAFVIAKEPLSSTVSATPLISSIAYGAVEIESKLDYYCMEIVRLRDLLENMIINSEATAYVLYVKADRVAHISCIAFPGANAESLAYLLNEQGVYVEIMGEETLSFALSFETTEEEIKRAALATIQAAARLQKLSEGVRE